MSRRNYVEDRIREKKKKKKNLLILVSARITLIIFITMKNKLNTGDIPNLGT